MLCYFGYKGWRPRIRSLRKNSENEQKRRLDLREKRKRNISEPMPIVTSSTTVQRLLGFQDNNNMFVLTDGSSISESPCHRGFNPLYSDTSSATTDYATSDNEACDDSVFVDSATERLRRNSIGTPKAPRQLPPKPPRMRQKRTFVCQNSACGKSEVLLGKIQVLFKSCNFCFTHYCSAKCQNASWCQHRKVCYYGGVDSSLIEAQLVLSERDVNFYLSKQAYDSYVSKGRGCLFMVFSSPLALNEFIEHKIAGVRFRPSYSTAKDVLKCCVSNRYRRKLLEIISTYEPASQIVVNIAVVVGHKVPNNPVPRSREVTVRKITTLDLHQDFAAQGSQLNAIKECQSYKHRTNSNGNKDRRKSI